MVLLEVILTLIVQLNVGFSGIESDSANFAHIGLSRSTNISILNSYFHHAHGYGSGGKAYGIACQSTTGECLIENNIFKHLRHSILLQSGANGNVFGYNYSVDPYWVDVGSLPTNSAGDMVLHGNYAYANLFEGNICQNIVIDNSHGINGPYNTFFRNRAELYGIFMNSSPASDSQNFIGNEVTNPNSNFGLYSLSGSGHFEYGNNVKGGIVPSGTTNLSDNSYYYNSQPPFLQNLSSWPSIGINNPINSGTIPAKQRYLLNNFTVCGSSFTTSTLSLTKSGFWTVYPNPSNDIINIEGAKFERIELFNQLGQICFSSESDYNSINSIGVAHLVSGIYYLSIYMDGYFEHKKVIIKD